MPHTHTRRERATSASEQSQKKRKVPKITQVFAELQWALAKGAEGA